MATESASTNLMFLKMHICVIVFLCVAGALVGLGPWLVIFFYSVVLLIAKFDEVCDFFIWLWRRPPMGFFDWLTTVIWVLVGLVVCLLISDPFTPACTDFVLALKSHPDFIFTFIKVWADFILAFIKTWTDFVLAFTALVLDRKSSKVK
ncbi:hypothetical protein IFR05_016047 [Cadophora sp. M221]|nr:hypothetical protein IFR05_016047 [Cadophora sp. M221]